MGVQHIVTGRLFVFIVRVSYGLLVSKNVGSLPVW